MDGWRDGKDGGIERLGQKCGEIERMKDNGMENEGMERLGYTAFHME